MGKKEGAEIRQRKTSIAHAVFFFFLTVNISDTKKMSLPLKRNDAEENIQQSGYCNDISIGPSY